MCRLRCWTVYTQSPSSISIDTHLHLSGDRCVRRFFVIVTLLHQCFASQVDMTCTCSYVHGRFKPIRRQKLNTEQMPRTVDCQRPTAADVSVLQCHKPTCAASSCPHRPTDQLHLTRLWEIQVQSCIVTTNSSSTLMGNMYAQCFAKRSCTYDFALVIIIVLVFMLRPLWH